MESTAIDCIVMTLPFLYHVTVIGHQQQGKPKNVKF